MTAGALGIDVGGTSVKAALIDGDGRVSSLIRAATPTNDPDGSRLITALTELRARLLADGMPAGTPIGMVVPGIVDEHSGSAVWSSNLGYRDVPFSDLLHDAFGHPVAFGHDVRAGAIAEAALRDLPVGSATLFAPIGTGVSIAAVVDGSPLPLSPWAGEIGQRVLTAGAGAGVRLERFASASAIANRAGAVDARSVAEAVRRGAPDAQRIWSEAVDALAEVLSSSIATVAPHTVIIGGGLAEAGDLLLVPLAQRIEELLPGLRSPRFEKTLLGDLAAAHGAALLARRQGNLSS